MEAQGNGYANEKHLPIVGNGFPLIHRASFTDDFVFGAASAAFQFEGAANEGGRGPSIWDDFTKRWPGRISDGSNGNMGIDFYHQFKEDVKIMKKMGLEGFRFSISWSRILPSGQLNQGINKEGIQFYNDLIDDLLANDITPFATLFHWDVPQALEDAYGGFLSSKIVADFCDYVDLCFWEFGDRVKHWITLNEPWWFSNGGYVTGASAPGRGTTAATPLKSSAEDSTWSFEPSHRSCTSTPSEPFDNGNPATEPYIVAHNLLLAHAAAVDLYRKNYQACQKGKIGITNAVHWMEPYSDSKSDIDAAERALDFMFGWFMDPVVNGCYPKSMRKFVGNRLPEFSHTESEKLKGSYDFIGVNYYTARYVSDASNSNVEKLSYTTDPKVKYTTVRNGVPIGPQASCGWIYVYPQGIYEVMMYTKKKYKNPIIYITENGLGEESSLKNRFTEARVDEMRTNYLIDHLRCLREAIDDGAKVKGYFVWSLFDSFEWASGYTIRFGMIYIEYRDGKFTRYPKGSAKWYMNFLKDKDTTKPSKNNSLFPANE
ncbi:raucaffricine-O-beta-D-glucosidase-like isoform X3 [Rhododendron vialii]|uniref:raucaffricine-O-beta-D-glucosidase-like isoform X3 n=1 Tax=Rhododendron vialii TaxID=182163 RepID=UPI00265FE120|nr:raucaffricine-O-beta-D-glucosidase-like isoform X3 [Rhododendron vialii]